MKGINRIQCGKLTSEDIGEKVHLAGWVHNTRNLGGLLFIDLRDWSGLIQLKFDPSKRQVFHQAQELGREDVILIKGKVVERGPENINPNLPTGKIEVEVQKLDILNKSKTPPFSLTNTETETGESTRLEFRYIDLRRPKMQENLKIRHRVFSLMRNFLDKEGFVDIETPILTKSTPEGARDFLIPSRTYPGKFYALPQSPQQFKQILMMSGFEKYYQIARCFRDEDLRKDRQPEFTQLDLEMSFVNQPGKIMAVIERMMKQVFERIFEINITIPFSRITHQEAIDKYGTDRPDLRVDLPLTDLTPIVANSEFKIFSRCIKSGGVVKGLNAKGCGRYSRNQIDDLESQAKEQGAKGLLWAKVGQDGLESPFAKHLSKDIQQELKRELICEKGDLLLFLAGQKETVNPVLGKLRLKIAEEENFLNDKWQFIWITDFPLFKYDEQEKKLKSEHHPFTAPREEDIKLLDSQPQKVKSNAYDLVLNGVELGGGSIRIHQRKLQEKIFKLLDIPSKEAEEKFGHLLRALEYGAPPHGGIALGLDRLIMLMAGEKSIREVIAFPKTSMGSSPLTGAPMEVRKEQLDELGIQIKNEGGK